MEAGVRWAWATGSHARAVFGRWSAACEVPIARCQSRSLARKLGERRPESRAWSGRAALFRRVGQDEAICGLLWPLGPCTISKVSCIARGPRRVSPSPFHLGSAEAVGAVAPILEFLPRNPSLHNELAQVRSGDDPVNRPSGLQLLARFLPDSA